MSVILRCTNDLGSVQDIQVREDLDLRLDISAIENATIGDVYGISSQEFSIPGSNEVNQFFGNLYNLGATPSVALQNSIPCQVLYNGAEVFTGKLYIKNIITDQQGFTIYNVVVVNETVDFKFEIQDNYLAEYDFSRYNHDFTYANVSQSWGGGLLDGSIVYPFVNYGKPEGDADAPDFAFAAFNSTGSNTIDNYASPLRLIDFKPAIRAKDVLDIIFSGSSYDYTSSFISGEYFSNLYVLPTANDELGPNNVSPVSQSAWAYISSSVQTITNNTQTGVNWDATIVDNANNFSLINDRYTADTPGNYQYQINVAYTVPGWAGPSPTKKTVIVLRKNGSQIIDSQQYFSPPESGSMFLQGGVNLAATDYLEVEVGTFGQNITLRNDQGKPSYLPAGYLSYFQLKGPASVLEGNVNMAGQFPDNLKAIDFLQGLIEKFNLVVEPVPNSRNLIRIEPYQDWINAGRQVDWTDKVDRDIRFSITHPITEQPRTLIFSDEDDEDILNQYTLETKGVTYGSYEFVSDSDLAEGERRIGKVFAATPVTGIPNGRTFVVPHLCSITDNRNFLPIQFKPRLLYNNGLQTVPDNALGIQTGSVDRGHIYVRDENTTIQKINIWNQMSTLTSIPTDFDTGQDLHFNNLGYSPYFQATANGKTKNDAFRDYWATYINSLYDIDSRKLTCNVYLKPTEIQNIALNDKIFIDGAYYRINKINGANLTRRDSVEVELIKIIAQELKFPRRLTRTRQLVTMDFGSLSINGTGRYINTATGLPVEDFNEVKNPSVKDQFKSYDVAGSASVVWDYQVAEDPTNQLDQSILGTNKIAIGASKVNTLGNNNQVKQGSETSLVVGSENLVGENTSNVTILGKGNIVDELAQNVQILGGTNNAISGSTQSSVIGSIGTLIYNSDNAISINGESDAIRDSDYTTAINSHLNEVIVNGNGHAVIGLNREGDGLDLLNTRPNSNWLGDTYLGGALFRDQVQLECGDGTFISLTGSAYTDGRHENLYILNWSGLSPGATTIELPNANNNDYTDVVYQFQANGTFDGFTDVNFVGFLGQTINGVATASLSDAYAGVTFTTYNGNWITLAGGGAGVGGPTGYYGNFYSSASQALDAPNVSQSVGYSSTYEANGVSITGSKIVFDHPGVYQFNWIAQLENTDNAEHDAVFWVKYNGNDYPNSNTYLSLPPRKSSGEPTYQLMSATFTGTAQAANDYIELYWTADSTTVGLFATASNQIDGEPATPSVIANVIPVGTQAYVNTVSASYAVTSSLALDNLYTASVNLNTLTFTKGNGSTFDLTVDTGSFSAFPFSGSAVITGSLTTIGSVVTSGSARGEYQTLSVVSNTASLDCLYDYYTLSLPSGSTHISASNVNPGQTISIIVTTPSVSSGSVTFSSNIKSPYGIGYTPTSGSSLTDVLTLISTPTNELLMIPSNNFL
jgi:hypothetical protein